MNTTADAIVAAYLDLAEMPVDWIRIARLRPMVDATHEEFTATLTELTKTGYVHLVPESNRKVLTKEDHEAAIRIGSEDKHLLGIEEEYFED